MHETMNSGRTFKIALMVMVLGLLVVQAAWAGSANGSATAKGGENTAKISKHGRTNTGAMKVLRVKKNGRKVDPEDYEVTGNGSTRPKIDFVDPLAAGDTIDVTLSTGQAGTFTVDVTLTE